MIEKLEKLAAEIESSLSKDNVFSEVCFEKLSSFENDLSLEEFEDVVANFTVEHVMPKQLNVYNDFGQPPVTIFNNGTFVVDLYFWMNIDTSIHSHSFSGAFKVLYGRSIHESYSIKPKKILSTDMMQTDITLNEVEILEAGSIKEIVQGNSFNHRLIHLDKPTITLCVRSISDENTKQWHHFSNGLSVEKKEPSQEVIKSLYYYNYIFTKSPERGVSYLKELIATWDNSTTLNLYERLSLDPMGVEPYAIEAFLDLFVSNYGETPWFKLYEGFFATLEQNYIELEDDSAQTRFIEHVINFNYDKATAVELLEKIQGTKLTDEQNELLSNLE